jgi:hypothetical protein
MENLPVILIITANDCGACNNMRGDGKIKEYKQNGQKTIGGKYSWDINFFKKLLSGNLSDNIQRFRVYEIYLESMSNVGIFKEINEFVLKGKDVIRYSSKVQDNKIFFTKDLNLSHSVKCDTKEFNQIFQEKTNLKDIFDIKVPDGILPNFIIHFPLFLFFDGNIWNESIKKERNIFGYNYKHPMYKTETGIYQINRNSQLNGQFDPIINSERFYLGAKDHQILSIEPLLLPKLESDKKNVEFRVDFDKESKCKKFNYKFKGL